MNQEELDIISRTMAGVLRHFPERYNLDMDEQGWIDLKSFVEGIQIRQKRFRWLRSHHVLAMIDTDPKGRYQFRDGKIRATYAHSIDVDLDLPMKDIPDELYYPSTKEELDILLETGLKPTDRKLVHLSKTYDSAMEAGRNVGMITMDESLRNLYVKAAISQEEALFRAEDKVQMRAFFQS